MPVFAQRGGRGGGGNNAEATEFQDFLDESNILRRVLLGETFIAAHRTSSFRPQIDQLLADTYAKNQEWAKVISTAERLQRELSGASPEEKAPLFTSAMLAAVRTNDLPKALQFGDWLLAANPSDINPYQILSPAILERLPEDASQRTALLDKALDYARKGIALAKPQRIADADWNAAQYKLHLALAFVHLNMNQFANAISEYEATLKSNPRDAVAQFRLGMAYSLTMQQRMPAFLNAVKAVDDAAAAKAETVKIRELEARREAAAQEVLDARDDAVDAFARAVAIGSTSNHPVTPAARQQLEPLFKNQAPNAPPSALDELIAKKKVELGL
jgi:tetratricopeptide (TPR) repeat protein